MNNGAVWSVAFGLGAPGGPRKWRGCAVLIPTQIGRRWLGLATPGPGVPAARFIHPRVELSLAVKDSRL